MTTRLSKPAPLMTRIAIISCAISWVAWENTARAATFTWATATSGNFSDATRWGGVAPSGDDSADILQFNVTVANTAGQYTATNETANQPFTLGVLTLGGSNTGTTNAATNTITAGTLQFGGATPTVNLNANNTSGSGNQTLIWLVSSAVELTAATTFTGNGNATFRFDGAITGAGSITKTGTSNLQLGGGGLNTFDGGFTLTAGTVTLAKNSVVTANAISSSPFGLGTLTLTGGTLRSDATARTIHNNVTLNGNVTISSSSTTAGGLTFSAAGLTTPSTVTLTGTRALTITNRTVTFNNAIVESGGSFGFIKAGTAAMTLGALNTYTGDTTVNAGVLSVNAASNLGADVAGNDVFVNAGGTLNLAANSNAGSNQLLNVNGGVLNLNTGGGAPGAALTVGSTATAIGVLGVNFNAVPVFTSLTGGVFAVNFAAFNAVDDLAADLPANFFLGSTGTATLTSATLAPGTGDTYRLGGGGGTLTVNPVLAEGVNPTNLAIGDGRTNGGGTVIIGSTVNTFTGTTNINNGTVSVGDLTNKGEAGPLGAGTTAIGLGSATAAATLRHTGAAADATDRDFTFGTAGGVIELTNTAASLAVNGQLSGGRFVKAGGGAMTLNAAGSSLTTVEVRGAALTTSSNVVTGVTSGGVVISNGASLATRNLHIAANTVAAVTGGALTIEAGGSLSVGTAAARGILDVATRDSAGASTGLLDLSAASSFTAELTDLRMSVNLDPAEQVDGVLIGTMKLASASPAAVNNITATTQILLGDNNKDGGGLATIILGQGQNNITTPTLVVGSRKSNGAISIAPGGTFTLNNGVGPATDVNVGRNNVSGSGVTGSGRVDLTGGTFIATLDVLDIANESNSGAGGVNGTFILGSSISNDVTINSVALATSTGGGTGTATGTLTLGLGTPAGTVTVNGNISEGAGGASAISTLTLDGADLDMTAGNITVDTFNLQSGILRNVVQINSGAAVSKTTSGSLELAGTNAFTGVFNVAAGLVNLSGSLSGAANFNVNTGTLNGIGSTARPVVVGDSTGSADAILAPGTSIGTLSTGSLSLNSDAVFQLEIDITSPVSVGTDLVDVSGDLALTDNPVLSPINLGLNVPLIPGTVLTFIDYSGSWNGGTFAGLADDSTFLLGANEFRISYDGVDNATSAVTLEAVPEPGSLTLLLGGCGLLGFRRFRRRKA